MIHLLFRKNGPGKLCANLIPYFGPAFLLLFAGCTNQNKTEPDSREVLRVAQYNDESKIEELVLGLGSRIMRTLETKIMPS